MAYIRCDINCQPVLQQPKQKNSTDCFGNTFDNFHVDYEKRDVDNNLITQLFDPNTENYKYTWDVNSPGPKKEIIFQDTNWTRRLVNNAAGVKKAYVEGPYFPVDGTFPPGHPDLGSGKFIVKPTDKYSNTDLYEPVYLASETDDDIWIVDEANDDIFVIDFVDPVTITPSGTTTGHLRVDETGTNEVTNESGNPVELSL